MRRMSLTNWCCMCNRGVGSIYYLLLHCLVAQDLWLIWPFGVAWIVLDQQWRWSWAGIVGLSNEIGEKYRKQPPFCESYGKKKSRWIFELSSQVGSWKNMIWFSLCKQFVPWLTGEFLFFFFFKFMPILFFVPQGVVCTNMACIMLAKWIQ